MRTARPDRYTRGMRLQAVINAILEALDEGLDGRALAARAMLSEFHFNRLVRAGIGEAPATFRRRLLLERAAWQLRTGASVTEAALEAGYEAVEAFSRAFSKAYGVPPSRFTGSFRQAAPNGIHFHPPGGLVLPGPTRSKPMDLTDRLVEHECWHTQRLLEQASTLPDEALDRALRPGLVIHDFEGPEPDLRTMLERIVFTKEVWTAAIAGRPIPPRDETRLPALQARLAAVQPQFKALVDGIRERGAWDDVFVDALCEPPVSFTYGSVVAHILSVSGTRRHHVIGVLRELGVAEVETRDPMDWERMLG